MIISKPLATRADGVSQATRASRVKRGTPLSGANNFAALVQPAQPAQTAGIPLQKTGQALLDEHARQAAAGNAMAAMTQAIGNGASGPMGALHSIRDVLIGEDGIISLLPLKGVERAEGLDGVETAIRVAGNRKKQGEKTREAGSSVPEANAASAAGEQAGSTSLGALSARFESGTSGIAAIGYDRNGGTSYGKYQLSSRAGSMGRFIEFLKTEEPEWAERLEKAGPANTGGRRGKMPDEWQALAREHPERLEKLQAEFIRQSHFDPAVDAIASQTGVAFDELPAAMQEVVFSTAVQHGPSAAARLITRAMDQVGLGGLAGEGGAVDSLLAAGEKLIRRIYALRSGQFGSSAPAVQTAVKNRLHQEMSVAITMLKADDTA